MRTIAAAATLAAIPAMLLLAACSNRMNRERYEAEKALFNARKMRQELVVVAMKPEFLERTLESYRGIVREYRYAVDSVEGLELIVVSAQMEIAELEFLAWKLRQARDDFREAYVLATHIPEARANALYSAAFLSQEIGDYPVSLELYRQFHGEFLSPESVAGTASMNPRYLVTPLKLSDLYHASGNMPESVRWLEEAERIYAHIIRSSEDPGLIREMNFNLLTTYLQQKQWQKALRKIEDLRNLSNTSTSDQATLMYLEAKIHLEGFGDRTKMFEIIDRLRERYPNTQETAGGLLLAGNAWFSAGEYGKARDYLNAILEMPDKDSPEAIEAAFKLAQISEATGDWLDASLRYKALYTDHPTTYQGFEAPLRIARYFSDKGERDAARSAYQRAIDHYEKLVSGEIITAAKIMAEEYIVRAYTEQKEWIRAAGYLLSLPEKYPDYPKFRENYLMAASIFEKELGDRNRAAEILQTCIDTYPGSDLAAEAEKQHKRIKDVVR